jgi:DHA2 family multidrug resistance protein
MVPVLGWLGGFLGNRNLFVAILVGFVLTSIGCGLAVDIHMLIFFRLVQGFILGPIEGLTAVLMVQAFPPEQRGMAIGLRSIGWSAGQIVSFTLGGYFLEHLSWRMIFFLGIPSGIVSAILGLILLPQQREYRVRPVDYPGLGALAMFLVPLILGISWAQRDDAEMSTLLLLGLATRSAVASSSRGNFAPSSPSSICACSRSRPIAACAARPCSRRWGYSARSS